MDVGFTTATEEATKEVAAEVDATVETGSALREIERQPGSGPDPRNLTRSCAFSIDVAGTL